MRRWPTRWSGTQVDKGERTLKVIFGKEVSGRQLVSLHLEKNVPAEAGEWVLPRLRFPEAKSVRGDVGVATVPGFRVAVGTAEKLSEKPISYFPKKTERLQQAFRVREREWSASMVVEKLAQSVQADVFHLYSLKDQTAYASVVLNYFVTGAPGAGVEDPDAGHGRERRGGRRGRADLAPGRGRPGRDACTSR